jgi:cytochrome b
MQWHFYFGYALLALLLFRLLWGFVGSETARFTHFLRGPEAVAKFLGEVLRPGPERRAGHNPLGGWAVMLLIVLLAVQGVSGLYSSDEIALFGPLSGTVSADVVELMNEIHAFDQNLILGVIVVHVIAVFWHMLYKKETLIRAMFSGRKELPVDPALRFAPAWLAWLIAAIAAAIVWGVVTWPWGT